MNMCVFESKRSHNFVDRKTLQALYKGRPVQFPGFTHIHRYLRPKINLCRDSRLHQLEINTLLFF